MCGGNEAMVTREPLEKVKLLPAAWQVAQEPAMPVWFMAVLGMTKLVRLAWQVLQSLLVVMWVAGLATTVTLVKLCPPWQFWQVAVDTPAWFMVAVAKPPGLVLL